MIHTFKPIHFFRSSFNVTSNMFWYILSIRVSLYATRASKGVGMLHHWMEWIDWVGYSLLFFHNLHRFVQSSMTKLINFTRELQLDLYFIVWYDEDVVDFSHSISIHYWLRLIKSGQSRFWKFVSHLIGKGHFHFLIH